MRIALVCSEAVPFAKTGGLADVTPALAKALSRAGHEVVLVLPHYPQKSRGLPIEETSLRVQVPISEKSVEARLFVSQLSGSDVPVWLVDQPAYFDRPELYVENGKDYPDNCERFVFLCRAAMEFLPARQFAPDVVHVHDWQTGLIPALLELEYGWRPEYAETASVITIHNMAFQGQFWHWDMPITGLDWRHFNSHEMEFYGDLNLLKTGLVFSDVITTVSPTYAREIQTPEFGCGMEGVLQQRHQGVVGILNGVDTDVWNPETDPALAANYDSQTASQGKARCKAALQQEMKLPLRPEAIVFGMISRLTDQKGLDLIMARSRELLSLGAQFVFLGTGEARYEQALKELAAKHPAQVATVIGYDDGLAHRIEAGADAYLMPSRFEPCGLNQMYSLRYGTLPIVHRVGGLADSVVDATAANLASGTANGFAFPQYDADAFAQQVRRAAKLFREKDCWSQMIRTGMEADWSWNRSAAEYAEVYERACQVRRTRR